MTKTIRNIIFILLFLTLGISTAFLTYLHFFATDDSGLSGEWTADLDMTQQAAVTAYGWLQDIEGVSVSLEDMESRMQGLTIKVNLIFDQTDRTAGTFQCHVSPESYETCKQAAYEAFTAAFQELLTERLRMAGYTGSMEEDAVEALVTETFGMSTEAYLEICGPELLPALEELQSQYDGSGTYEMTEDILTRRVDDEEVVLTKTEICIRRDDSLILLEETGDGSQAFSSDEYPIVYTLQQSAD